MKNKLKISLLCICICLSESPLFSQVSFTATPTQGCAPLTVTFTNTSSSGNYFEWYWGDGSNFNGFDSTHTYTGGGDFWAELYGYDTTGGGFTFIGSAYEIIEVGGAPDEFYMSYDTVCPGDEIFFEANVSADTYLWNFGDGQSSSSPYPDHAYQNTGSYTVTLILWSSCGTDTLTDQVVVSGNVPLPYHLEAGHNPDPVCPNTTLYFYTSQGFSYDWSFGDGGTSTLSYPTHAYASAGNYVYTVTITNGCGNDTVLSDTVHVQDNLPISPFFYAEAMNDSVCPSDVMYFTAGESSFISYNWSFGDGANSTDRSPSHSYSTPGSYTVTLTAQDGCGNDTSAQFTIHVVTNLQPDPGFYDYGFTTGEVCTGDPALFYVSPKGASYFWDFGDGNTTSSPTLSFYDYDLVTHAYSAAGTYNTIFTLTNGCGNSFTDTVPIEVSSGASVEGDAWAEGDEPYCAGDTIQFTAIGGSSYQWNFGDGSSPVTTTGALSAVTHVFANPGSYDVYVVISNSCGDTDMVGGEFFVENCLTSVFSHDRSGEVVVYPNPARDVMNLSIGKAGNEEVEIRISDMLGRINIRLFGGSSEAGSGFYSFDLRSYQLPDGMYFLTVRTADSFSGTKFMYFR